MQKNKRVVVKVGTKTIMSADRAPDRKMLKSLACQIASVSDGGTDVILVTSGAIGSGMSLLGIKKRPKDLAYLQAAAAIGQCHLMHLYSEYFHGHNYGIGQILLTQDDFNDKARFLNIKHTINTLLKHKAVPVINENDTVATEEIKCGDNDRLSSLVAALCGADMLIILSDVDGLLDENGSLISKVRGIDKRISKLQRMKFLNNNFSGCDLGSGGMATKLAAVGTARKAGIKCVIANGRERDVIKRVMAGEALGTRFD